MAHTIFHSPDREDIIRRKTPRVTIEAARNRRIAARRAVLGRFQRVEKPTTQDVEESATSMFGAGRASRGENVGTQGGLTSVGRGQPNLSLLDVGKLAFAPTSTSQMGVSALSSELFGALAPFNVGLGLFGSPIATLGSSLGALGGAGSALTAGGSTFRGTDFGIVNQERLTRELSGGRGGMGPGFAEVSSTIGGFSPTYGVDVFGQISGPSSSNALGLPGTIERAINEQDPNSLGFTGGDSSMSGPTGSPGSATGSESPGSPGSVGHGGGIGL